MFTNVHIYQCMYISANTFHALCIFFTLSTLLKHNGEEYMLLIEDKVLLTFCAAL